MFSFSSIHKGQARSSIKSCNLSLGRRRSFIPNHYMNECVGAMELCQTSCDHTFFGIFGLKNSYANLDCRRPFGAHWFSRRMAFSTDPSASIISSLKATICFKRGGVLMSIFVFPEVRVAHIDLMDPLNPEGILLGLNIPKSLG